MDAPDDARDRELLDAWRRGDRAAGETLYRRYYSSVVRFFRNKVADHVRDDLVQETFAACVRQADQFQGQGSFRSYVLGIAWRRLMDHLRVQGRRNRHTADIDLDTLSVSALGQSPESSAALRQEQRLLLEGLRQIPLMYQIALELHYWEHLPAADVAEILAIPVGTAKTRLRDGRKALEKRLAEIAASPERLACTLDNLERWAARTRQHFAPPARDDESGT
jgi:RNA polymerase sigma-70 factor, ECF subfamily